MSVVNSLLPQHLNNRVAVSVEVPKKPLLKRTCYNTSL